MNYARGGHLAVKLKSGKVLVLGGIPLGFTGNEKSEIYDPATNHWTLGPEPVISNRHWARGVLLNDSRVLIVGGETIDNSNARTTSRREIEIYDPVSNSFQLVGMAANARAGASVTKLNDGRVLILGGSTFDYSAPAWIGYSDGEIFDPSNNQLHAIWNHMGVGRAEHSAVIMDNGNVMVAGGMTSGGVTNRVEIFQIGNEALVQTNSIQTERAGHYSALLPSGRVIVGGGWTAPTGAVVPSIKVEKYMSYGAFESLNDMPKKAFTAGVTTLSNSRLIISGGDETTNNGLRSSNVYAYDFLSDTFILKTQLTHPRAQHSLTELDDGSLLAVGGFTSGGGWDYTKSAERFSLP